jgi:hypothetical protein
MLDKQKGDYVVECNGCGAVLETHTSNFSAAVNLLRREGWKSHKRDDDEDWKHFCKSCQFRR